MSAKSDLTVAGFTEWSATYDETIAKEVEQYSGMPYVEVLRRVVEGAAVAPGGRVLDIGTGTGALAFALAAQHEVCTVIGIDPTPAMLGRAEANARATGLAGRVEFHSAPAEQLPFAEASFDAVVSSIAFHHTIVRRALPEVFRVLKPGGRLVVADMSRCEKWQSRTGRMLMPLMAVYYVLSKRSLAIARAELAAMKQFYTKGEWEAMLREFGFATAEVQEFRHLTSEWYPSMLIVRASK